MSVSPGSAPAIETMGEPQVPQKWRETGWPLSPISSNTRVSPCREKAASVTAMTSEKALPDCRWQWRQWHTAASKGSPSKA